MPGEVVVVPAEPTQKENDDNFAAAFAQIAEADNASTAAAEKPASETVAAAKPAEEASVAIETSAEPVQTEEEKAAAAAAAAEAAGKVETPEVSDNDILRRLGTMIGRTETPVQEVVAEAPAQPAATFTADEMGLLEAYVKDYPDIARAESLIRRQEYAAVVGYIFSEIGGAVRPMAQTLRTLSERTHLGDLTTAVPDYAATREQVVDWASKQPPYLKVAYDHVIKQGTVAEVADLIKRYKAENPPSAEQVAAAAAGGQAAATTATVASAVKPATGELSPAARKAVAALAPVNSKRSMTVAAADPSDYDAAFKAFADTLS